jgi:hypothetical protein
MPFEYQIVLILAGSLIVLILASNVVARAIFKRKGKKPPKNVYPLW